jgi:hypothetical protein
MDILALTAHNIQLQEQLAALRAQLASLQPPKKPPRTPCPHVTSKGQPCKKYCIPNQQTCKVHGKPRKEKPPPKEKPKKVHCTGLNMRGNACKGKCLPDQTWCERHDPSLPVKEKKGKKKKVAPEHNHGVGVEPLVPCELCETHGDIFDGGVTDAKWVDEGTFWAVRNEAVMI